MLSVVIPTYNYDCTDLLEQLLKQTLSSTLPIEIIVCDDASTSEQTINANRAYCDQHEVVYIKNTTNLGRTATRNKLAEKAKYDWLLFLDADVLPVSVDFITHYLQYVSEAYQTVVGGIQYEKTRPSKPYRLRWRFGIQREARFASERNNHPYLLASGNFLIRKDVFLKANSFLDNNYGLDALFGYQLKKLETRIIHIDNPVYHLGLETNEEFLKKSIASLSTMVSLENKGILPINHTRLQQMYQALVGKGFLKFCIGIFKNVIKTNLLSGIPSLILFDLYRLYHYIQLKTDA